jgi:hypothetical protein
MGFLFGARMINFEALEPANICRSGATLCGNLKRRYLFKGLFVKQFSFTLLLLLALPFLVLAQPVDEIKPEKPAKSSRIKGERPTQLDIWKLDVLQCGINEVRLWYEVQQGKHASLEFGLGGIFRNGFWYDRGDRPMVANGFGLYFGYRKYMDKKRYFSEPKLRSYFSPLVFYRFSTYQNEWFAFTTSDPGVNDCLLQSEKIHQAAVVIRFGWQTTAGRIAVDFYSGMGFKFIPSVRETHVMTPLTAVCAVNSTSVALSQTSKFYGTNVIFNAGVKLGIRRNNKERHYADDAPSTPGPNPESPPQF